MIEVFFDMVDDFNFVDFVRDVIGDDCFGDCFFRVNLRNGIENIGIYNIQYYI
jgi:hypothetical protein